MIAQYGTPRHALPYTKHLVKCQWPNCNDHFAPFFKDRPPKYCTKHKAEHKKNLAHNYTVKRRKPKRRKQVHWSKIP